MDWFEPILSVNKVAFFILCVLNFQEYYYQPISGVIITTFLHYLYQIFYTVQNSRRIMRAPSFFIREVKDSNLFNKAFEGKDISHITNMLTDEMRSKVTNTNRSSNM